VKQHDQPLLARAAPEFFVSHTVTLLETTQPREA